MDFLHDSSIDVNNTLFLNLLKNILFLKSDIQKTYCSTLYPTLSYILAPTILNIESLNLRCTCTC